MPLIGFVSTCPSRTRRNRSGDEQTILPSGRSRYAANGAGLISRKRRYACHASPSASRLEPLREIHLIAIADANVLLHGAERRRVGVAIEVRLREPTHAKRRRIRRRLRRQARDELVPARERARVAAVADEPRAARRVIDDDGPIVEADREIRHRDVGGRDRRDALEPPAEVVTEVADGPAARTAGRAPQARARRAPRAAARAAGAATASSRRRAARSPSSRRACAA